MGVVNLFADMTYEGGASINGPFLGTLGAGAAAISIIAGLGEFLGYSLRSVSGYVSDKTGRHWLITFIGYSVNLLAVPAMALAGSWPVAAGLVLAERVGRAIRKPTVESMLSYTTGSLGRGWVYAVNSALDETGATVGPLLIALVLFLKGGYRTGYATQDTLLKAIIAGVLPEGRRNLAFGLFYLGYGAVWLVVSVTAGLLYERSLPLLIAFSVAVQLASIPVFFVAQRTNR
jgi:hypothetical protein